jgi:hypothetical protein
MSSVPFLLRFVAGWPSIKSQVNTIAKRKRWPSYEENRAAYRFSGWGVVFVGVTPCLACNAYFLGTDREYPYDMGRIVGNG